MFDVACTHMRANAERFSWNKAHFTTMVMVPFHLSVDVDRCSIRTNNIFSFDLFVLRFSMKISRHRRAPSNVNAPKLRFDLIFSKMETHMYMHRCVCVWELSVWWVDMDYCRKYWISNEDTACCVHCSRVHEMQKKSNASHLNVKWSKDVSWMREGS